MVFASSKIICQQTHTHMAVCYTPLIVEGKFNDVQCDCVVDWYS